MSYKKKGPALPARSKIYEHKSESIKSITHTKLYNKSNHIFIAYSTI